MVLSRLGIGAATVDTILPDEAFTPGARVDVTVELVGGNSSQMIENIYLKLVASNQTNETEEINYTLNTYDLLDEAVDLATNETRTMQTHLHLPFWTPITVTDDISVRIDTGLDIEWAVDPTDTDEMTIASTETIDGLFTAIEDLDFTHLGTRIREGETWMSDRPFVQTFTFAPETEPFTNYLDVMRLTCLPREDNLRVAIEIDQIDTVADDPDLEGKSAGNDIARLFDDVSEELRETMLIDDVLHEGRFEDKYGHDLSELDLEFDKQESVHTFENPYPDQIRTTLVNTIQEHTEYVRDRCK
jgi:sporulation-control protein